MTRMVICRDSILPVTSWKHELQEGCGRRPWVFGRTQDWASLKPPLRIGPPSFLAQSWSGSRADVSFSGITVECLDGAGEERSRTLPGGGQLLAVVRVGLWGEWGRREETWQKCHKCFLSLYYGQRDGPWGGKGKNSEWFPQTTITTSCLECYSDVKVHGIPGSQWQGAGKKEVTNSGPQRPDR